MIKVEPTPKPMQRFELNKFAEHVRKSKNWTTEIKKQFINMIRRSGLVEDQDGKQYVTSNKGLTDFIEKFERDLEKG